MIDSDRLAAALERQLVTGDEPAHVEDEELFAFADGTLPPVESEIVASHIEECDLCRDDLADLRRLRAMRPPRRTMRWTIAAIAASLAIAFGALLIARRPAIPERVPEHVAAQKASPMVFEPQIPAAPPHGRWSTLVDTALATGIARPAILDVVQFPAEALRSDESSETGAVIAPLGTAIDDTRPTFRWSLPAPMRAVVYIFRNGREVARSPELTATRWKCDRELARGGTYRWQVALGDDERILPTPPQPPADFHVIDDAAHAEIAEARRLHPGDHLLLGVLHARHGVLGTAESELRSYAVQHPDPKVDRLIRTVRSWKR
jgi:hypothetical protein